MCIEGIIPEEGTSPFIKQQQWSNGKSVKCSKSFPINMQFCHIFIQFSLSNYKIPDPEKKENTFLTTITTVSLLDLFLEL